MVCCALDMPFPQSLRVVYGENPLVEVICQLRYPTVLKISAAEPADFQERIGDQYPIYLKTGGRSIELPPELPTEVAGIVGQMIASQTEDSPNYKFATEDSLRTINLTRDFIALADKEYQGWEQYRANIELGIGALQAVYSPKFFSRIGLRYRNVIDRADLGLANEPWGQLLSESLIGGLLGSPNLRDRVVKTQTSVVIEFDEVPGGQIKLRHGFVDSSQEGRAPAYMIDADFQTEDREATEDAMATLDTFNRLSGWLFRWAISDQLHETLRPTPAE